MIEPYHLLKGVIRPVLRDLDLWSEAAERLVLGTACQESHCGRYLYQIGGPALGIYQMEPATHDDIFENFLRYHDQLRAKVEAWGGSSMALPSSMEMVGNLYYATAMCRIHYYRSPRAIPIEIEGQAGMWKDVYNTRLGKGTVAEYLRNWQQFVGPGEMLV